MSMTLLSLLPSLPLIEKVGGTDMKKDLARKKKTQAPVKTGDRAMFGYMVTSASGTRQYKISFDAAKGAMYWRCSCPGCCAHGQCKHLDAAKLKGRKYGHQAQLPTRSQGQQAQSHGKALPAGAY